MEATMQRRTALKGLAAGLYAAGAHSAFAQDQPVRIIVPYAAGGQTDSMARLLAESMQKTLGRTVLVENRPGAAALIAVKYVQGAPPDSDTLLFHNSGFVSLPLLSKAANYDPYTSMDPVAMVGVSPSFLMVTDAIPAKTVPEFLAYARANPGIECGNSGVNSGGHIAAMLLEKLGNIKLKNIPYKGSAEVTRALLGGEVKMQVSVTTEALNPHIKSGKIRLLATVAKEKTDLAPDVPPLNDFLPGYNISGWFGMLTAPKTPLNKREAMAAAIKIGLDNPAIRERFAALFFEISYQDPVAFKKTIEESGVFFANIVNQLGLKPT
jgi:tripartite-type tricarboxylate transporter receptor subunit TctC